MGRILAIEFTSVDGVIEDPDGAFGSPIGGWARRQGPETFAGDRFGIGPLLDDGALVFGRRTWELFAGRWPTRTGPFAGMMNSAAKLVASRTITDVSHWANSTVVQGDLFEALDEERMRRDLIVVGSSSIVHALTNRSLIDEYRLLVVPTTVGHGTRFFAPGAPRQELQLLAAEPSDGVVLLRYERVRPDPAAGAE